MQPQSSSSRGGRRRLVAAVTLAAAAASLAGLPAPARGFLVPSPPAAGAAAAAATARSSGGGTSRRPRLPGTATADGAVGGWRATTLHNAEAFQNNSGGGAASSSSSSSPPRQQQQEQPAVAAEPEDLQHELFKDDSRRVILFDGDCGFCSEGVNIFLNFDGDPRGSFRFASLQGEIGQELLKLNNMDTEHFNTIVLVDKDQIYVKSDAVLEIADKLRSPFRELAQVAKLFPLDVRDGIYGLVSRYRHLFGEKDSCRIPSESEMDRFLD